MKKLVNVVLAPQDSGVLFSLSSPEQEIGEGVRLSTGGAFKIIEEDSYNELIRGHGTNGREGTIIYVSKKEYEELKKQNKID